MNKMANQYNYNYIYRIIWLSTWHICTVSHAPFNAITATMFARQCCLLKVIHVCVCVCERIAHSTWFLIGMRPVVCVCVCVPLSRFNWMKKKITNKTIIHTIAARLADLIDRLNVYMRREKKNHIWQTNEPTSK